MYFYKMYGMNISSYKELSGAIKIDNKNLNIDAKIIKGKLLKEKNFLTEKKSYLHCSPMKTIFKIAKNGTYFIKNSDEILVEEDEESNQDDIKTYIFGSCMGFLMAQKNKVAIHGSSIVLNDLSALIITGDSGAGKSTLTSAFRLKGYKFLSDDVSAISNIDNKINVEPAFAQQKICEDAMDKMGYDKSKYKIIDEYRKKYIVFDKQNFMDKPINLKYICEICKADIEEVKIEEIKSKDKINLIIKNIYRGEFFLKNGIKPEYFKKIIDIAKNTICFKITRPEVGFTAYEQIECIRKMIDDLNNKGC